MRTFRISDTEILGDKDLSDLFDLCVPKVKPQLRALVHAYNEANGTEFPSPLWFSGAPECGSCGSFRSIVVRAVGDDQKIYLYKVSYSKFHGMRSMWLSIVPDP